jgi:hypothetical protein
MWCSSIDKALALKQDQWQLYMWRSQINTGRMLVKLHCISSLPVEIANRERENVCETVALHLSTASRDY